MATFKPTSAATTKKTFQPTKYAGYSTSTMRGWQNSNQSALDIINEYQEKIKRGDWLSTEDRQKYKSAVDTYTSTGNSLRQASKHYGQKYTADEEKSWNDSLSSLGSSYDEIEKHYSQWRDEDDYRGIEHWLEKPSQFDDGWQFGDGFKAVAGTLSDLKTHLGAGMLGIGEGLVDALATLGPYLAQGQYYANGGGYNIQADQAFNNAIATQKAGSAEFVKKDLYDEDAIARMLPDALEPITGINIDQHSVLGGKADSVVKSSGQMLGTIALQGVGVPWWLTTGATSLGSEAENALRQGASLEEAAFSGLVSAGAEILTEKLFGGIKFVGGQTVDDVLLKPLMNSISNKTLRTIVSKGVDIAGEGLEEVFSGMLGAVGQKLSYASEQEWKNLFSSEDALDSLIGGVAMSLGLGGASAKVSDAIVNTRQGAEMQKAFGKGVGADITAQTLELNGDNKYAQKLNSKLEGGKNLSAYQTGKILGEYKSEVNSYDIGKVKAAAESRLAELGETGDVSAIADAIARETVGEELSFKDRAVLNKSTKANIVLTEMMPENIKGGNLANKWAEGIGTKRVNADVYNLSKATVTPNTESSTEAKIAAPARDVKAAIEQAAKDKIGKIEGFTEETANVMVKDYDGSVSPSEYVTTFEEAFKLGRDNAQAKELTRLSKESSVIGRALLHAYDAGLQSRNVALKATNSENSVLQNGTESGIINTESESITNEGKTGAEGIRLRNSGKWFGGKNTEGQIRRMEGGAGQNPQWREGRSRPADGEATRLLDEGRGREVRVADLGILNGSKQQKVRVIDEQDYTAEIKEAVAEAEAQGLTARVFVGDDILIEEANGSISGAHAYILGKQMLIRADHEKFTSKQFARHEIGHDKIAKGQVDIKAVRKRLEETVGKEAIDSVAQAYAEAYGRTGLSADEIWEECICDSLGDMNIFTAAGLSGREGRVTDTILAEIKAVTESETKAPTQTRGSPEGKASRSIQKAKYLSYTRVGIDNVSYIKEQLQKIYGDIESGIADEIAIARGNKVFIVDSGRENGKIKMGVREILNFSDLALRDEYVRRQNDDAVSEGRVSDELSSKLKSKDDSGRKSNLRRESGSELQTDTGKSDDQQSGVLGENADKRGIRGKASRELDSLGNELTKEQQEYFKDSKVRDKKGNLMVLYHGTTANFNTFKKGDVGYHFGTKGAARGRAGFGKNVTLKEVYLNITNPIVFDEDLGSWDADYRLTEELYDKGILTQAEVEVVLLSDDKSYRRTTEASNKKLASLLGAKGYDGIAYSNTFETKNATTSYIAFHSNQAKEITNKTPTSNPDIRYSRELDLDYDEILNKKTEVNNVREEIRKIEVSEDFKAEMNKLTKALDSGDVEGGIKAYKEWEKSSGYGELIARRDRLLDEITRLQNEYEEKRVSNAKNAEQEAIEKSGLSEADYFRKQAEKEFGYTPYYYDAGYILPNGKMLNFSGEKGKHYGTRGEDHRAISIIYADTQGTKALTRFMNDGNIRIMAESPGLDIASKVEPSREQYSTIRSFIYDSANREYFNVDISDESGMVIGSLEYDGKINPTRIINDIKHYYETGEIRDQSEIDKFRYSRELDIIDYVNEKADGKEYKPLTNRELLASALESVTTNDAEREKLKQYKDRVDMLNRESLKLSKINEEIKELTFGKGNKNPARLKELKEEAIKTSNRINLHDKKLLSLEATKSLKDVLDREKKKAYKAAAEKGREALHRNVEGRHKTAEIHKIQGVAKELDKLLNRGTKERNVKNGEIGIVRAALDLSNMLFATDDELILNGMGTDLTKAEAQAIDDYLELYEEYHSYDGAVTENKGKRAELRSQMHDLKETFEGALERERNRISEAKASKTYDALIAEYKKLENSDEDYIKLAYRPEVAEYLESLKADVGENTIVSEMSLDQLKKLHRAFSMIKHMVSESNKLFRDGKRVSYTDMVATIFKDVDNLKNRFGGDYPEIIGKALDKINEFGWNNLRPVDAFELVGSEAFSELFWDNVKSQNVYAKDIEEVADALIKARNKYGYKNWDIEKSTSFTTADGRSFNITLGEMMSIYAYSKRAQADAHMRDGGFQHEKKATYKDKNGIRRKRAKAPQTYRVHDKMRIEIINALTKQQRAYVDEMQALLTKFGEKGNEASRILYGIDLFTEDVYFPLMSSNDYLSSVSNEIGKTVTTASLANTGMTKATVPNASNPIILRAFDDVLLEHFDKMSKYHAYVVPIDNLRKVFDGQSKSANGDMLSIKALISSKLGNGASEYFKDYITDLNGSATISGAKNPLESFFGKSKGAAVAANISVWVQQYFSVIRAFSEVNPRYFLPFMGESYTKVDMKLYDEMKKYAPITTIKEMGGFDVGSNRGITDYIGYDGAKFTTKKAWKKFQDAMGIGAEAMDKLGWMTIWKGVKKEVAATGKYKSGSEAYFKACGERFEQIIAKTQVYDSVNAKSGLMRAKNPAVKYIVSFMGEPTTIVGMVETSIVQFERAVASKDKAKIKAATARLASTVASVVVANAMTSVAKALVYGMRDDDEDETYLEKYAEALGKAFRDDLNLLNYFPIARDIASILEGYDVERPDMTLIADVVTSFRKAIDSISDEEVEGSEKHDKAVKATLALANMLGIPAKTIYRDIDALVKMIKSSANEYRTDFGLKFTEGFKGEELNKGEKLYQSIIIGDTKLTEYYKSTYKDENTYLSAVRKALRENDPRLREAAIAKLNGDNETYKRLCNEVLAEGKFDRTIIIDAFAAEYNYQKNKADEEGK